MKIFLNLVIAIAVFLAMIGLYITPIWALVSFIIYLVKDIPFDWMSVYSFFGCLATMIVGMMYIAMVGNSTFSTRGFKMSKWEERLARQQHKR